MKGFEPLSLRTTSATRSAQSGEIARRFCGRSAKGVRRAIGERRLLLILLLMAASISARATDPVLLPVEIVGGDGTTASRTVKIHSQQADSVRSLWLQVHGLRSSRQASIQINASPWLPLSNQSVTVSEPARSFGGIGVFGTVSMTVQLPPGTVVPGSDTIRFRFNRSDGIVSGYRVLAFNFLTADGSKVLFPEDFAESNPDDWTPPLPEAASIQAGKRLWQSAPLIASALPDSPRIQAHCGDCHASDGRDLKYFNFSNESIIARSRFHGLSEIEGELIASYIRSLPYPNPGRPWNPPYQPGPGIEEQPPSHWAAGAGLASVLEHDTDAFPHLLRQQSATEHNASVTGLLSDSSPSNDEAIRHLAGQVAPELFRPDGNLDAHQIPIALELPDWSQWLPQIHPKDAWGESFTRSKFASLYGADARAKSIRTVLQDTRRSGRDIHSVLASFEQGTKARHAFFKRISRSQWTPELARKFYSTQQWQLVKTWELMQEFGLEGRGREIFGPNADARTWLNSAAAETAPAEARIPNGRNGIGGSALSNEYLNSAWYELQLVLNSGNHHHYGRSPVDWIYLIGHFKELYSQTHQPEPARLLVAVTKAMQSTDPRLGPQDPSRGWRPDQSIDPRIMVSLAWEPLFRPLPVELRRALISSLLTAWMDKTEQYAVADYLPLGQPYAYHPSHIYSEISGGRVWQSAQQFREAGVSSELIDRLLQFGTAFTDRAARIHYE